MSYADGLCDVCDNPAAAYVRHFEHAPYVDGRFYAYVCWTCANVPKVLARAGEKHIRPGTSDGIKPRLVHTAAEMMADGWSKEEASQAIRNVSGMVKSMPVALVGQFGAVDIKLQKCPDEFAG